MATLREWDFELDKKNREELKKIADAISTLADWQFFSKQYPEFELLWRMVDGAKNEHNSTTINQKGYEK